MVRLPSLVLAFASLAGCDGDGESDALTEWLSCADRPMARECPADAHTLDADRGQLVIPADWQWSGRCLRSTSAVVYVQVPDDIDGLHLTVDAPGFATSMEVTIDGEPQISKDWTGDGPLQPEPVPGSSRVWPLGPDHLAAPGCWAIAPSVVPYESDGSTGRLIVTWRRGGADLRRLPIRAVRASSLTWSEAEVEGLMTDASSSFERVAGLQPDLVANVTFDDSAGVVFTAGRLHDLMETSTDWTDGPAVNVFLVDRFAQNFVAGQASGIPGSIADGTGGSGVAVAVEPFRDSTGVVDAEVLAEVLGHEIGHHLGLFHPSEADGREHDPLPDTPECANSADANGNGLIEPEECPSIAPNLMFWATHPESRWDLTPQQIAVLRASPLLQP